MNTLYYGDNLKILREYIQNGAGRNADATVRPGVADAFIRECGR
jgi:hypothetical protein